MNKEKNKNKKNKKEEAKKTGWSKLIDTLRKVFYGWRLYYDYKTGLVKLEAPSFNVAMTPLEILELFKRGQLKLTDEQKKALENIINAQKKKESNIGWMIMGGAFLAVALVITVMSMSRRGE